MTVQGHEVTVEQLESGGEVGVGATSVSLRTIPGVETYDALVLASPVNGGRMSVPMESYLDQLPSLGGKRVAILLTHFLFQGGGADQTIKQMVQVCAAKGATVSGAGTVRWSSVRRGREIAQAVEAVMRCLDA
jgi:multimeric flavodoxin WrbA